MKILIVLGHPNPGSFNHALAAGVRDALAGAGHQVTLRDLAAEGFDPRLTAAELDSRGAIPEDIKRYCEEVQAADGIVIVHPNWWGQPPATGFTSSGWNWECCRAGLS
jgi:putative NADPH-quinone reductase